MSNALASAPLDAADYIKSHIRTVPDWPQAGVQFRDITPLLQEPKTLRVLIDLFVQRYIDAKLDYVAGLEARGFIFGPILAYELNLGFIPIRKAGKLPYKRVSQSYELEYGTATVEIHEDACKPGDRVMIIDDLIATGGTMMAGKILLERLGAVVVEGAAIIDLPELGGSKLLSEGGLPLYTVTRFDGH
jgi:adenine phosphoribosyltransferase